MFLFSFPIACGVRVPLQVHFIFRFPQVITRSYTHAKHTHIYKIQICIYLFSLFFFLLFFLFLFRPHTRTLLAVVHRTNTMKASRDKKTKRSTRSERPARPMPFSNHRQQQQAKTNKHSSSSLAFFPSSLKRGKNAVFPPTTFSLTSRTFLHTLFLLP